MLNLTPKTVRVLTVNNNKTVHIHSFQIEPSIITELLLVTLQFRSNTHKFFTHESSSLKSN